MLLNLIPDKRRNVAFGLFCCAFGNRVGTHEDNTALYAGLVHRLPDWLSASGFALLYTMEYRLLETCLKREPRLRIIDRTATEAGGLTPHVFLVRRA